VNSEVEPWVGDNDIPSATADPDALVGTWQQDRFSSGGSSGLLVAYSHDGGRNWTVPPLSDQPAITNCQDPDGSGANSDWERATDPWSDIAPNGDMWFMSLSFNDTRDLRNAMLVSKSEDDGAHWTEPVTLIDDANPHVFNDKNSLTADPNDSNLVYAVWDRLVYPNERTQGEAFLHAAAYEGPTYFSKTENGTDDDGGDWTTRKILDLGRNDQTIANQIAVLPRAPGETESTLIDVFDWIHNDNKAGRKGEKISAMWSTDSGETWSEPVVIDAIAGAVVLDRDPDGAPCPETLGHKFDPYVCRLRTGDGVADTAVDLATGDAYVVWQDGGPGGRVVIRLAKSSDHGQTWTQLGVVNGSLDTDAHTPAVEVADDGTLAVTYYDFRFNAWALATVSRRRTGSTVRRTAARRSGQTRSWAPRSTPARRRMRAATSSAITTAWAPSETCSSRSGLPPKARRRRSPCSMAASTPPTGRTCSRPRLRNGTHADGRLARPDVRGRVELERRRRTSAVASGVPLGA
jgi:hypothetical protein